MAYDDPTASVSDVLQVKAKCFARPETALQHQQHERPIAQAAEMLEQRLHLSIV